MMSSKEIVKVRTTGVVEVHPENDPNDITELNYIEYSFDYAFDELTSQEELFEKTTKRLVYDIIDGYNATCFAYGATGTGKTYR